MRKLCVMGWRPFGRQPWFYRGGKGSAIYLSLITDTLVDIADDGNARGEKRDTIGVWVRDIAHARVLEVPIVLTVRSFHPKLDRSRFNLYSYEGEILETQIFRPRAHWR